MPPKAPARSADKTTGVRRDLLAEAVRLHQKGRLNRAAVIYERILRLQPKHPDALHLLGLIAHQKGDAGRAETLVRQALAADARPAAFHNSLGVVLLAAGRPKEATDALAQVLARNPLYAEALNNLGIALLDLGRPTDAIGHLRRAVDVRPAYVEAQANLGRALDTVGRHEDAIGRLEKALALKADYAKARRYLGDALGEAGRRPDAEAAYRLAIATDGRDAENHAALASLLERTNHLEDALTAADAALRLEPGNVRAAVAAARCERRLGRPEAGLKRLAAALDRAPAAPEAMAHLLFEKGTVLDRLGAYDQAFEAYAEANARAVETPAARRIDRDLYPARIRRLKACFTAEWVAGWSQVPGPTATPPAFLVGFPRSGTTLLDQCLDAHPGLRTLEEKDCVDVVRRRVDELPGGYPEALADLAPGRIADLRATYSVEVARHLGDHPDGLVVDKMPLNTIDAGLIHRLFPAAPFILALRHPCDVVLSAFMQAFQPNAAMIHFDSLEHAARFYAEVMDLWLHYVDLLPLPVVTVRYEDLTEDLAGALGRVLDGLDVPWDESVLGYAEHAKARAIATPSYHQVVQPIYRRSVGRWQNYRARFEPVLPILAPFIEAFGYAEGS